MHKDIYIYIAKRKDQRKNEIGEINLCTKKYIAKRRNEEANETCLHIQKRMIDRINPYAEVRKCKSDDG